MIVSNLENSFRIEELNPLFKKLFDYVKSHDLLHEELGKVTINGDDLFINNVAPECVDQENQKLEVHRRYLDVHILLEGKERIGWKPLENCVELEQEYDEVGDCALYNEPASAYVDLLPGQFVVVYPEDAHAPVIGNGKIRKLIAKVKL